MKAHRSKGEATSTPTSAREEHACRSEEEQPDSTEEDLGTIDALTAWMLDRVDDVYSDDHEVRNRFAYVLGLLADYAEAAKVRFYARAKARRRRLGLPDAPEPK